MPAAWHTLIWLAWLKPVNDSFHHAVSPFRGTCDGLLQVDATATNGRWSSYSWLVCYTSIAGEVQL